MKNLLKICMITAVLVAAVPAMATYTVDFIDGTTVLSDPLITLSEWGQYESGGGDAGRAEGTYGGIGTGNSRMVWGNTVSGDTTDWAEIIFPEAIASVTIRHLNGSQYDSFNVMVDNVFWGSYTGLDGDEEWFITTFSGTPGSALILDVTSNDDPWHDVWGQLAIDYVSAEPIPEPATLCLLGLGALSLIRRKR